MALGLTAHDQVARLERVRLADEVPLAIERAALADGDPARPGGGRRPRSTRCWRSGGCGRCARCSASPRPTSGRATRSCSRCRWARRGCASSGSPTCLGARRRVHPLALSRRRLRFRGRAADPGRTGRKDRMSRDQDPHAAPRSRRSPPPRRASSSGSRDAGRGGGRGDARRRPAAAGDGGARVLGPCGDLSEVRRRARRRRAGGLGRAVGRVDLRPAAAAGGRGLPRHLAVGPEPGHRRDDAQRRRGRAR